jgi:hypothetical protein
MRIHCSNSAGVGAKRSLAGSMPVAALACHVWGGVRRALRHLGRTSARRVHRFAGPISVSFAERAPGRLPSLACAPHEFSVRATQLFAKPLEDGEESLIERVAAGRARWRIECACPSRDPSVQVLFRSHQTIDEPLQFGIVELLNPGDFASVDHQFPLPCSLSRRGLHRAPATVGRPRAASCPHFTSVKATSVSPTTTTTDAGRASCTELGKRA